MTKHSWMLCALLTVILPAGVMAQDRELTVALRDAQQLLVAAYPELREGRVVWRLDATASDVTLEARRVLTVDELRSETPPLVGARVRVDEQGA